MFGLSLCANAWPIVYESRSSANGLSAHAEPGVPANLEMQMWSSLEEWWQLPRLCDKVRHTRDADEDKREKGRSSNFNTFFFLLKTHEGVVRWVGFLVVFFFFLFNFFATQHKTPQIGRKKRRKKKGSEWPLETPLRCRGFCLLCLDANMLLW